MAEGLLSWRVQVRPQPEPQEAQVLSMTAKLASGLLAMEERRSARVEKEQWQLRERAAALRLSTARPTEEARCQLVQCSPKRVAALRLGERGAIRASR